LETDAEADEGSEADEAHQQGDAHFGATVIARDFNRARVLLRQRADALVLDLAKRYLASVASELTTVLDAMDSLAEFERMHPLGSPLVSHGAERGRASGRSEITSGRVRDRPPFTA
jgi:hypothetical protein